MKKIILFFAIIGASLNLAAQQSTVIKQLNGRYIAANSLEQRLAHITDSARIAGMQVVIINHGRVVWKGSFGYKDIENRQKLNDSTAMYAASLTKTVSAYLFLRLADKGIFNLDRPLYQYLKKPITQYPKWQDLGKDMAAFQKITARMLLSHTSGMPVLRALYKNSPALIAKPGEKFYYSNEGFNLLGTVIEEHTGKPLDVLAQEEVFGPLHMMHTSMIWRKDFEANFSDAYFKDGRKYGSERRESSRAAGSMTTTATDYARFIINLMQRKGLSAELYKQMLSPQFYIKTRRGFGPLKDSLTTDNDAIKLAWGLGVCLFQSPYGAAYCHAGHGDANQNYYVAFPKQQIAVVIMCNSENFEAAADVVLNACIGDRYSPLAWLGYLDQKQ